MKKFCILVFALVIGVCFAATGFSQEKPEAAPVKPAVAADTPAAPEKAQAKKTPVKKKTKKKPAKKQQKPAAKKPAEKPEAKPVEKPAEPAKPTEPAKN
jgi:Skp family chaperone for outer membrane proteins